MHAGIEDRAPVARVITTVHTSAGEVDHRQRALKLAGPIAELLAIPTDLLDASVTLLRPTREHHDFETSRQVFPRECLAKESAAASQHNASCFHVAPFSSIFRAFQKMCWRHC